MSTGESVKVNDLSEGTFDVTITTGPGFATKRQEAVEAYMGITQGNPEIMAIAGDLIMKSMDLPYAEDIAERLKVMLPPPVQEMLNKDAPIPPEAQAIMQQAQQAMQQVQQMGQEVQQAAMDAEKEKSVNEKDKAEIRTLIANLKTEEARFEAKIAKSLAGLAERQSNVAMAENKMQSTGDMSQMDHMHGKMMAESAQVIESMRQMSEQFTRYAVGVINEITEKVEEKPKVIRIDSYRENGKLVAVPVYEEPDHADHGRGVESHEEMLENE